MSKVKVSIGRTYNTGNYQSLRLDVGLEDECENNDYEESLFVDKMYESCIEYLAKMEKDQGVS